MPRLAKIFDDLEVWQTSYALANELFKLTRSFPREEMYSLTDQVRRSSRSVCSNLAEAWFKRRYQAAFASKLTDSLAEAGETMVWIRFSRDCDYLKPEICADLLTRYEGVIKTLGGMVAHADKWCFKQ